MSDPDDPFGAGNGNRTVIRPRPGGAASPSGFGSAPASPGSTVFSNQPFGSPAANTGGPTDWVSQQSPETAPKQAPPRPTRKIPLNVAIAAHSNAEVKTTNPITQAAVPLLVLLGRLRQLVVDMDAVPLMQHVARSINEFERTLLARGIDQEQVQIAKYTLCATADDIVQNLPGTEKHVWLQYSMLAQFFGARTSGTVLFDKIRQLLANPTVYYDLLELIHSCLSLGFEGQYRSAAGGDIELQRIRRDVFQTLRTVKPRGTDEISPRWRGVITKMRVSGGGMPLWAIAGLMLAFLAGVYMLLRFIIAGEGDAMAQTMVQLHPKSAIEIRREEFTPMVAEVFEADQAQLDRIRNALAPEIEEGLADAFIKGEKIVVAVSNVLLFPSGSADVTPEFEPLANRIAVALDKEPGPINIIGHTDNVKLRATSRFKSNYDLSVKRAESVAALILKFIAQPERITVTGRGEDDPVASNDTAENRAKNRRVEINIPREESL
ncbi:type VI secretion system protein TssL, long form [Hoeflea ulvae]|uniref:Type VI secretion system protein TssL, long form n=1 Tax=Hoeflea ulvae TaxID=2983764 RepID=A0ABT3YH00_9HYPH|nr:type VI secretion system protein TssL, long form [Hoeflea ulvae]MCY0095179.1 type VI secretion system protein TssL, long form [Hoeflea ulvae]